MKRFLQRENTRIYHVWLRSFMVCLCLALAGVSAWGQDAENWINEANTEWYNESEIEFTITTAEELAGLAQLVNDGNSFEGKTITLDNDIKFQGNTSWIPIGNSSKNVFAGTFDGKDNTISNFDVTHNLTNEMSDPYHFGLFGNVANNANIKNLNLEGNITINLLDVKNHNYSSFGGIVGQLSGNGSIDKCKYSGEISVTANGNRPYGVGGICGYAKNQAKITNCSNIAIINLKVEEYENDINAEMIVGFGGILGMQEKKKEEKPIVENCFNEGKISIEVNKNRNVFIWAIGGVVGVNAGELKNCYNKGEIVVFGKENTDINTIVGGVSGYGLLSNCYNVGAINVNSTGDLVLSFWDEDTGEFWYSNGSFVGGVGGVSGNNTDDPEFINCYNYGKIITDEDVIKSNIYVSYTNVGKLKGEKCYYLPQGEWNDNIFDKSDENVVGMNENDFKAGKVAWLLRDAGFGQNLNGNPSDEYPKLQCFDGELPAVYQLKYNKDTEVTQYYNPGQTTEALPELESDLRWFGEDGTIYESRFPMPAKDLVLTAETGYSITIDNNIEHGEISIEPDQTLYKAGTPITVTVKADEGYQFKSLECKTADNDAVEVIKKDDGTYTFTMPAANVTVYATFTEKEDPTDPEEPVDPPVVDPTKYYNIYDVTEYDFINVSFSRNVVREGGSVNVYLELPEGLDPAAVTLMFKRGMYNNWETLDEGVQPGEYPINNIWSDIYVKAVVDESYIDPNPDENHIYIDLSETNDSIWLYTERKLVEEGKTAVIQAEVAKSCQNKEIRYMYKRTVLGEWKEMPKDYSINQYVVRDITTDIYVKAYFVFDKQDPTTAKNPHHVYADITATCEGLYLDATRHKVADEGDTKVFLYVKKGFETKDARYQFKRGLKGEWEDLVPGIEQNTFQVTNIEGDIYLKGIDAVYTGTEDIDGMVRVYTKDGSLFVYTAQPEEISVVSMTGVTVKRTRQTGLQSYPLNQGIYVVCVGEQVFKVRVK